jgi:hypothetical protein
VAQASVSLWVRKAIALRGRASAPGALPWLNRWNVGIFLTSFTVLLALAEYVILRLRTTGDEPWYLLQTYALLHLHSPNLAPLLRNHALYASFLGTVPDDHTKDYLGNGERVLVNMPGYAAAIAPFYLIGGRPLVVAFQALVAALVGTLVFIEAHRLYDSRKVAVLTWLAYLTPLPVLLYAGQIFPSTLAAGATFLGFLVPLRYLAAAQGRRLIMLGALVGALAFVLPWLHVKYTFVALAVCATAFMVLRPRLRWPPARSADTHAWYAAAAVAGLTLLSFILIALYSHRYFGTWTPPNALEQPDLPHPHVENVIQVYGEMFLDPRTGLLPWVPLDLLVIPGLALLWRRHPRYGRYILLILAAQLGAFVSAAVSPVFQGYALIARFTLECSPFFALCVGGVFAFAFAEHPGRQSRSRVAPPRLVAALSVILLGMTIWFSFVGELDPRLLYPGPTVRLAAKYPDLLPGPWFALFPWFHAG